MTKTRLLKLNLDKHKKALLALSFLSLVILSFDLFHLYYSNKVYPRIKVAGVELSGLTYQQAENKLLSINRPSKLILVYKNRQFDLSLNDLGVKYNDIQTLRETFSLGREKDLLESTKKIVKTLINGTSLPLSYVIDRDTFDKSVEKLANQIEQPHVAPTVLINKGQVVVNPGKNGEVINKKILEANLLKNIEGANGSPIEIKTETSTIQLTDQQIQNIKQTANNLIGKKLLLTFEDQQFNLGDNRILTLLDVYSGKPDTKKVEKLASDTTKDVNRLPEDAKFVFEEGKVKEFNPAKDGVQVKTQELVGKLESTLQSMQSSNDKESLVEIPIETSKPQISTGDVNELGIRELIGRGKSSFRGSIPNRVHNIALASARLNGVLIKPGEEFSFLKALGDVSVFTGYKQAYVIKDGKTVLGDGGGVCQVSTTFFRAALATGLPIIERHQHSYRVSYYEQDSKVGIDATVFEPSVDLRIKNDTPNYILVQSKFDKDNLTLVFDLYGTPDGRKSLVSNFRSWDITNPPPAVYIDDPTLPAGTIKQTEHSIKGIKTAFDYKVTRDNEVLQDKTFYSNYRAWQAVYLRGTAQ